MYTSCAGTLAGNIAQDCAKPLVGGYTGRGLLIPWDNIKSLVKDVANPRIVSSITLNTDAKLAVIDNVFAEPFTGSQTASSSDTGRASYTKTVAFRIPLRGAAASKDVVEPMLTQAGGFLLVLEKNDKVGDGSYEIVGSLQPFKVNADGITRDEAANGGDITVTGASTEPFFEVTFFDTDYDTTKTAFDALMANSF